MIGMCSVWNIIPNFSNYVYLNLQPMSSIIDGNASPSASASREPDSLHLSPQQGAALDPIEATPSRRGNSLVQTWWGSWIGPNGKGGLWWSDFKLFTPSISTPFDTSARLMLIISEGMRTGRIWGLLRFVQLESVLPAIIWGWPPRFGSTFSHMFEYSLYPAVQSLLATGCDVIYSQSTYMCKPDTLHHAC